ncbi:MAG TPA: Trk family potassium uptake protein, partial [Bacilli bacterium]
MSRLTPPRIMAIGFAFIIIIGAVLLSLPIASANGTSLQFIDALFTATSATCVTGLVVVDTGSY